VDIFVCSNESARLFIHGLGLPSTSSPSENPVLDLDWPMAPILPPDFKEGNIGLGVVVVVVDTVAVNVEEVIAGVENTSDENEAIEGEAANPESIKLDV